MATSDGVDPQSDRQRLAVELRQLRDLAGISGRELALRIGISQSKVSRIESGTATPSLPDVEKWAEAVGAPLDKRELLITLTKAAFTEVHTWRTALHGRTHLQDDLQELERSALRVSVYQPTVVPGLLQTAEYARRVFSMFQPAYAESDIPAVLAGRLDRQLALYEENRTFDFLITEAALRWRPGPVRLLLAQMDRIASVSTLDNVSIGLIPHAVQAVTSIPHGFVILDSGNDERDDETDDETFVLVETVHANLTIKGEHVTLYQNQWSLLWQTAIFNDEARAFLAELSDDIRKAGD